MYATLHRAGSQIPPLIDVTVHQTKEEALDAAPNGCRVDYAQDLTVGELSNSIVYDLDTPRIDSHSPDDISQVVFINDDTEHLDELEQEALGPWTSIIGYSSIEVVYDAHPNTVEPSWGHPRDILLDGVVYEVVNEPRELEFPYIGGYSER